MRFSFARLKAVAWPGAWPDLGAFFLGLGLAWWQHWRTTDLIWSLWLSSLFVGYGMILWQQSAPLRELVRNLRADRSGFGVGPKLVVLAIFAVGTLFTVAFFTVHFGGFHFVHSLVLGYLFPVSSLPSRGLVDWELYAEVVGRYWWFVPAAFLAERHAFAADPAEPDTAVTPAAIKARLAKGDALTAPYRNVIRMHLLILFFAAAYFIGLEGFLVYAVVYAVYFFPWRLLRPSVPPTPSAG